MQRLRIFPFAGAFQRPQGGAETPAAPEDKRATGAKALWPDNKAILPEPAASAPADKNAEKRETRKSEKRAAQKDAQRATRAPHKPQRLPPAPPLDAMPPFGTLADAPPIAEGALSITPSYMPQTIEPEEEALLLTQPLTINPSFTSPPAETNSASDAPLAIQPQVLGQSFMPPLQNAEAAPEIAHSTPVESALVDKLSEALHANLGALREVRAQLAQQAVELALTAARAIAGHAIAADSLQVLRARLPELLSPQEDAPPLRISVSPQDEMAARTLINTLAQTHNYQGQISIEADPRLERGDAMVNWRHYAWRSLVAERRATVEASVSRYLAQLQESQLPQGAAAAAPIKENDHG